MQDAVTSSHSYNLSAIDADQALALLHAAQTASWRQYPGYAYIAAQRTGADQQYYVVKNGYQPAALANVRTKSLPVIGGGIAMIAQGPVMLHADDNDAQKMAMVINALATEITQKRGYIMRCNLPVLQGHFDNDALLPMLSHQYGADINWCAMPDSAYQSFIMDIRCDEEELRASLAGKWRTDLRRGEKGDVDIVLSHESRDFEKFQPLLEELASQKGFSLPQDANFFAHVASAAAPDERFAILLAYHEGALIGGHIGAYSADMAVYLLGATNAQGRSMRASYLLQWAAIAHAQKLGMSFYDLGGVDEDENPDVFRFKKRMGGTYYRGPDVIEARPKGLRSSLVLLVEKAYQRAKG
ncbi:lipid II:glycine glycyltransferase FemX [Parasphingorhabdus sp. DH2-15]|uniref:lipid II:glycine glycyltransferase FemX n=1 Tax=Parasphingorhabdus sp. DH2-15 TaxID=3444112 RepID=UPI003F6822D4